jgi:hypothetical protein
MNLTRSFNDKFAELPVARREKISARAADLIADETS